MKSKLALIVVLLVLVRTRSGLADDLEWDPAWPRFRPIEYAATSIAGAASLGIYLAIPNAKPARFTGGVLLDEPIRSVLRLRSPDARNTARFISDLTAVAALNLTLGIDSFAVPLARKEPDLALQMTLMNVEAFAFSTLITNSIFKIVGRGRPPYEECEKDSKYDSLCHINDTSSFPSGHTNVTFTAAGLSCAHHLHLPLYDDRTADVITCGGSLALAVATGTLRIVGDRHYATDVWVGALIGFAVGYGVPTLLHYDGGKASPTAVPGMQPLSGSAPIAPIFSGTF